MVLEFYKFHFFYNFDGVEKKDRVDPKILYEVTKQIFDDIQCLSVYEKWDANSKFSVMVKYNDHGKKLLLLYSILFLKQDIFVFKFPGLTVHLFSGLRIYPKIQMKMSERLKV